MSSSEASSRSPLPPSRTAATLRGTRYCLSEEERGLLCTMTKGKCSANGRPDPDLIDSICNEAEYVVCQRFDPNKGSLVNFL
jgi:hypothetical protein